MAHRISLVTYHRCGEARVTMLPLRLTTRTFTRMRHTPQLGGSSPNPESLQDTESQGPRATKARGLQTRSSVPMNQEQTRSPRDEWVDSKSVWWKCRSSGSPPNTKRSRAWAKYLGRSKSLEVVTNGGERRIQVTPPKGRRRPLL